MRNKQDMEPNLKQCLTCKKCVEEILTHVMLQFECTGHKEDRIPLVEFIQRQSQQDRKELKELHEEGRLLNHILPIGGHTPQLTKIAMECLEQMLQHRTT